jgi:hypothetical protein
VTARELYSEREIALQAEASSLRERERTVSLLRLLSVAAAIGLAFWSVSIALIPFAAFIALIIIHDRIITRRKRAQNAAAFYTRGISRIAGTYAGTGDAGAEFGEEHHPYAGDFDLFGRGSLFELISIAVTRAGRARLAAWLKVPSLDRGEIVQRQEAVRELRDNLPLREDVAVLATEVTKDIESARLEEWAALPPMPVGPLERLFAWIVPATAAFLIALTVPSLMGRLIGWTHPEARLHLGIFASIPAWPLVASLFACGIMARRFAPRVAPVIMTVERAEPALALLAGLLARIEKERFTSPRLVALIARLRGEQAKASEEIERLRRLVGLLDARRNQFFAPFAIVLLWVPHVAMAIERWRMRSGSHIADWTAAVGEVEALASLASFSFEHDSFVMPEIVPEALLFDARGLGHPLIPSDRRVTNDVRLDATVRLLVVSGSNMSGKSTMMRSIGIAAVLAMAGAPVCATSLRFAPTAVGASIRIHDSLQENASRFFAEILRIRQVLELSKAGSLLFLLDEILAGTNSHDRRIGAEAVVRGLLEREAIGLVSTHDLALAQIADSLAPRAANVHFEDHIEEDRVVFDYRMRPGVVTKSNALALMRSVGIEV